MEHYQSLQVLCKAPSRQKIACYEGRTKRYPLQVLKHAKSDRLPPSNITSMASLCCVTWLLSVRWQPGRGRGAGAFKAGRTRVPFCSE